MKITVFSIVPLFPDYDMGGAQKHLRLIARHLGERGHEVTILATWRYDTPETFQWHPKVTVHSILQYKQPFPQPYDTGALNLANIIQDIAEHLQGADRFYIHDGEMLFPYIYEDIPTVVGLRDNVYPETMLGAYLFRGDTLIVISDYSRRFIKATVGRFFPDLDQRLKRIHNGLDWEHFKHTPAQEIYGIVPQEIKQNYHVLVHPHRPEDSKGMWQVIDMVENLSQKRQDFRVLSPRWIGTQRDSTVQAFYERMTRICVERGIDEYFISHDWVPYELVPQYYSMADVTLSLGSFVESFGNAVYESLGCGTPSVVARVATHRELLPDSLIDKVDFGDAVTAAEIVDEILTTERRTSRETLDYLKVNFNFNDQLETYAETIENARVRESMRFYPQEMTPQTAFKLAPWCYVTEGAIYHDFKASYYEDTILLYLLETGLTVQSAQEFGVTIERFEGWYREGYIVPKTEG